MHNVPVMFNVESFLPNQILSKPGDGARSSLDMTPYPCLAVANDVLVCNDPHKHKLANMERLDTRDTHIARRHLV